MVQAFISLNSSAVKSLVEFQSFLKFLLLCRCSRKLMKHASILFLLPSQVHPGGKSSKKSEGFICLISLTTSALCKLDLSEELDAPAA